MGTALVLKKVADLDLDEIYLVTNMAQSDAHGKQLSDFVNDVTLKFLGRTVKYLGAVGADEMVQQAQRKYRSVVEFAPGSRSAADFRRMAQALERLNPITEASGQLQFFLERFMNSRYGES